MTIQDLGAMGEFVASIAVLVTLIFLAIGMRQNTSAIMRSSVRQVTAEHVRVMNMVSGDPGLAELVFRGWSDLDTLTPLERYRFDLHAYSWLAAVEQAFADYDAAHFPEDSMVVFRNNVPGVLSSKGGQRWWSERQVWFSESFREHVEGLLAAPRPESVAAGLIPREPGSSEGASS